MSRASGRIGPECLGPGTAELIAGGKIEQRIFGLTVQRVGNDDPLALVAITAHEDVVGAARLPLDASRKWASKIDLEANAVEQRLSGALMAVAADQRERRIEPHFGVGTHAQFVVAVDVAVDACAIESKKMRGNLGL